MFLEYTGISIGDKSIFKKINTNYNTAILYIIGFLLIILPWDVYISFGKMLNNRGKILKKYQYFY
jgi:hypothetical protein